MPEIEPEDRDVVSPDDYDLESLQRRRFIIINGERVEVDIEKAKVYTSTPLPEPVIQRMARGAYPRRRPEPVRKKKRDGYVYVIKSPTGHYKIGRASDPYDRMKVFEVKLPFEVEFEHLIKTKDMYLLESELHVRFESQRVNGEWFLLTSDDVAAIKQEYPANQSKKRRLKEDPQ